MMDDNILRQMALNVFAKSDTETLMNIIAASDADKLATAELDAFNAYVTQELTQKQGELDAANAKWEAECYPPKQDRVQSNVSQSLRKMNQIDVFKSPRRETTTIIKKEQPFFLPTSSNTDRVQPMGGQKERGPSSELLSQLFGGNGSFDAKGAKLDQQSEQFPVGFNFGSSEMPNQENHSDDESGF